MITTVTTVTTVTTMIAVGVAAALGIVGVICLILFLTTKELASATNSGSSWRIAKFINVGILPLTITFAVIVAVRILGTLA